MTDLWGAYFRAEREIKRCAISAGIPRPRAAQLARELACHPLRRKDAARLLALVALRRSQPTKESQ